MENLLLPTSELKKHKTQQMIFKTADFRTNNNIIVIYIKKKTFEKRTTCAGDTCMCFTF